MKKLFIFFVLSIFCLDVWSQAKLLTQCKFGLKLGLGMHTITGSPVKTKPRTGLMGGMWFQIKMNKSWTLQSELTYIQKGTGRNHDDQYHNNGDYFLELTYFEVPILFQYNKKNVYFEFGPGLAALIKAGEITGGALPYPTVLYPLSNKDVTFNVGTGYVFNEKWRIGLRLTHSLLPVRKQLPETSQPMYNRGIVLSVSRQISLAALRTKRSQDIE